MLRQRTTFTAGQHRAKASNDKFFSLGKPKMTDVLQLGRGLLPVSAVTVEHKEDLWRVTVFEEEIPVWSV